MEHLLFEQDRTVATLSEEYLVKNNAPHVSYGHVFAFGMPFDLLYRTKVSTAAAILSCQSFSLMV